NTATSKIVNFVKQIHAIVNDRAVVISESSVRNDILFDDEDGITCLTNDEIFENLALMSSKSTAWNEFSTNLASAVICLAKGQKFNFRWKGVKFLGKVTPLFDSMLVPHQAPEGEGSEQPTEPQPTPSPTHPSTGDQPPVTDSSSSHDTTQDSRDSLEDTNGSEGTQVQSSHDSPLSGDHTSEKAEGGLNLEELFVLCTNLSNRVLALETSKDAQAAEILKLKDQIKKLKRKCKPSISHHRAWLKSVKRLSMKKRLGRKESVSKQGRKNAKPEPTLDAFDDLDADGRDYMETEDVVKEGRQSNETKELKLTDDTEVIEDKSSGDKGGNTEELVSTARPKVSTSRPNIDAARQEDSAVEPRTPPTTTSIFDDEDITMAQTLIKMKEEKAKEKGVSIKDVDDSSRPERSILTLKPLPTINPKDKGKSILEEPQPTKNMTRSDFDAAQIVRDAEIARHYIDYKERFDALFAAKLQQEEREEYTIEERAKFLAKTIAAQRKFRAAQRSAEIRNIVMSDSDESGITYTAVSSPFEDLSDIGSPRADDHEYLELPYIPEDPYLEAALQAPPSPDYVPGPEEPEQAPLSPDYVPGPEYADDEIVAEDQPGAEDAPPTAQSPDYVPDTDPEADPEEDDDEDPEEDPIDYPADGGDDGDDEMDIEEDEDDDMDIDADEEDEDDEMDVEVDEEAEEEHSAPAYPVVVALPATAPSAEETEPFETDESAATPPPHPAYRMTARITIPEPLPIPAWSDSEVARLLAISSPPASPLSPCPIRSLGYRAATIRMRAEAAATSHSLPLPPPFILSPTRPDAPPPMPTSAPTLLPPLLLPFASRREDRPEVNLPPQERLDIALGPSYEVGESSAAAAARPAGGLKADYGFCCATIDKRFKYRHKFGAHVRDFESMVRRDTDEIYTMLDDEQSQRQLLASRVNMLFRDKRGRSQPVFDVRRGEDVLERLGGKSMDPSIRAWSRVYVTMHHSFMHRCQRYRVTSSETVVDLILLDIDCYADTIEIDDSTSGIGHHTAGACDGFTGAGDSITGAGYCITGTARTHWGSCTARAARGGW
ncbi:hypothetical protein Tco_0734188, partial [Tanacetum coccineum]